MLLREWTTSIGIVAVTALLQPMCAFVPGLSGQWSGVYELTNANNQIRYDDLVVNLKAEAGRLEGSAGPHEYEQYQFSDAHIDGSTIRFEVYRGRAGTASFVLNLVGDRLTGTVAINPPTASTERARVVLDHVPDAPEASARSSRVDLSVMDAIKSESLNNSQVMDHAFYLTDVYGPRLTGSRNFKMAGDWVVRRLRELGLENVAEESIPNPYPGWQSSNFTIRQIAPVNSALIGVPLAWSTGTPSPVIGDAVIFAPTEADARGPKQFFDRFRGKLK